MSPTLALAEPPREVAMELFEERLGMDSNWALQEASDFFMNSGSVQDALRKITAALDALGIPYALVGGMALFFHGYRRFTEDVDILVRPADLRVIHERLQGRGFRPPFEGSRHLRDTETGVKIEFLVSGQFPGDGKPKPVAFPDPAAVSVVMDGIQLVNLAALVELKLASGMTGADRQRDLVDVQELIRHLELRLNFASNLSPYVAPKFQELWQALQAGQRRYLRVWNVGERPEELQAMLDAGITSEHASRGGQEIIRLSTTSAELARRFGLHPEEDFLEG